MENLKKEVLNIIFENLTKKIEYLVFSGSLSYGTYSEGSDVDVMGIYSFDNEEDIIPKNLIVGYDNIKEPKILGLDKYRLKENILDIKLYPISRFFKLCQKCNPNILEILFGSENDIIYSTDVGKLIRNKRKLFLNDDFVFSGFCGYSCSQLSDITKNKSGRVDLINKFGYDTKAAMHCYRLLLECEQLLNESNLRLDKNKDILLSIKKGNYSLDEVRNMIKKKDQEIKELYLRIKDIFKIRNDKTKIRDLLVECIKMTYN